MANTLTFSGQTLTDANIFGGIKYMVDLNTGEEFSIGNTASASVSFVTDTQLPLYSKDQTNGTFTWTENSTARGRFYITEVTKTETGFFSVTAYDAMILLDTNISALSISLPATVSGLASDIATYIGCTVSGTIYNGTMAASTLSEDLTIRQLLGYIAEASGCSAKIDGADHLCFMYYASSGITISASNYIKLKVADYTCAAIDNVTIMGIDGQPCASYGSGTNTLFIQGNPFLYEATNTEAQVIYGRVSGFVYTPIECEMFDISGLEVGTIATFGSTASLVMHIEEQTEEGVVVSSVGSNDRAELNKSIEVLVEQVAAVTAQTQQHFWYTATGDEAGAHIAEVPKDTFETTPSGGNLLSSSSGVKVRDGLDVLAEMTSDGFAAMTDGVAVFEASSSGASVPVRTMTSYVVSWHTPTNVTLQIPENTSLLSSISMFRDAPGTPQLTYLTYGTPSSGSLGTNVSYTYDGDRGVVLTASYGATEFVCVIIDLDFTAPYFTLGVRSGEPAPYSTAIGKGVTASQNSQTAIGMYNEEDTNNDFAFIIGNGTDSTPSNAFTVKWNGDATAAGDIEDGTGNVLSSKQDALSVTGLTLTRTNNTYVNATSFARMAAVQYGKIGLIFANLEITTSIPTGTTEFEIGTITGCTIARQVLQTIPSQGNNSTILFDITTGGSIKIANTSGTATGTTFFRAVIPFWIS